MSNQAKVKAFHQKYGDHIGETLSIPPTKTILAHSSYMLEELSELVTSLHAGNLEKVVDGLADLQYTVYGMAVACGLDLDLAMDAVHVSNMSKGPLDATGKGGKNVPEYRPPDLDTVIRIHRVQERMSVPTAPCGLKHFGACNLGCV